LALFTDKHLIYLKEAVMNIFCTKAWNDFMCKMNTHIRTEQLSLFEMGDIFFSEWSFLGFKKWILYGTTCDKEDKLVDMIIKSALKRGIFAIESNFNMARWRKRDYFEKVGKITKEFGTYVIDLSESEDKLWERVHSKHRNVIRRAIKEGVEINLKLNINDFMNLLIYTYSKGGQKNPLNYDYLQSLMDTLSNNIIVAGAYHDGKLQSGIIVPYDEKRGYYLHGATAPNAILGSSNLLQWEIMKILKNKGVKEYDFGGARLVTDDPRLNGIFKFKERFGGRFIDCYYWEIVLRPLQYKIIEKIRLTRDRIRHVSIYNR